MKKMWKEKGAYIILCIIILLLLLTTVMVSKDKKERQQLIKEPILNQNLYEIKENLETKSQKKQINFEDASSNNSSSKSQSNKEISANQEKTNNQKSHQTPDPTPKNTSTSKSTPKNTKVPMPTLTPKVTTTPKPTDKPIENKNEKTAQVAVKEMKIGWNLGNTLDSANYKKAYLGLDSAINYYETLWGNPKTTKVMVDEMKRAGFNSIRVPVTYYDHINSNGTIDSKWIQRVKEVVEYVLSNDMYCILDVHHDTGLYPGGSWIVTDADKYQENANKLSKLWTQIATEFKDYDYKLVFEGFNEIVDTNKNYDWVGGHKHTITVNKLNQVFVDTVRKTGGKNRDRFLAVTTFGGITDEHKLSNFIMPKDTASNKIILALHDYVSSESGIDKMLGNIKKYCIDKNIPVILDEFGTEKNKMSEEERVRSASYYVSSAKKLGISCFWWDNGNENEYMIFNRRGLNWTYSKIKDALIHNS